MDDLFSSLPKHPGDEPLPRPLPPGWTDVLTVPLPPNVSVDGLVDFIVQAALKGTPDIVTEQMLVTQFGLSAGDAALVRDRTFGGIVRAATRNPLNCPSADKDPFAWTSFQRATKQPELIGAIYPQFAIKKPWWKFWGRS